MDQQFRTQWATVRWASQNRRAGARRLGEHLAPGRAGGRGGDPAAQRGRPARQRGAVPGAGHPHPLLLPAPRPRSSATCASWWSGCGGWTSRSTGCGRRSRLANARVFGGRSASGTARAGRRLLDPDGPAAEALDPGDARRGPVRPVPVLLRRLVVEQPAADGRADHLHRRPACGRSPSGSAGPRAACERRRGATRSYEYTLDSSQAAALTFRLLDRGVALRRDSGPQRRLARRRGGAPRGLGRLARELGVDVDASRRRAAGRAGAAALARAVRGRGHLDHDRAPTGSPGT